MGELRPGHGHHLAPKLGNQGLEAGVSFVSGKEGEERATSWGCRKVNGRRGVCSLFGTANKRNPPQKIANDPTGTWKLRLSSPYL